MPSFIILTADFQVDVAIIGWPDTVFIGVGRWLSQDMPVVLEGP